ncbi:sentrin-specific protease 8-like [Watersipora subatra]|uniref:sentrin-specific protease 8-like n=1 Tax=Watersipora subatra TaxID=2589382 RepID=UPI00355C271B
MASHRLLSYGDCLLDEDDLKLLQGPHWLNDKLIGFAFEYMTNTLSLASNSDIVLCCAEVVQLIKMCGNSQELALILESLDIKAKKHVFLPVNDNASLEHTGGSHWSLLVYEGNSRSFTHYDSANQMNHSTSAHIASRLAPLLGVPADLPVQEGNSPTQENGYDCGVYVIEITKVLLKELMTGKSVSTSNGISDLSSSQIKQARKEWSEIILNLASV